LEREGLHPTPEADRYTLIRRLSLDLTGLPPTLAEVDEFARDPDPAAYEKLVDRLLAKVAYGEHWARQWLDLARYADSAGYADDPPRTIWLYRDYVIKSFNANKPFDQFTIEQLAGDLLPNPSQEQLIATAFHRNTMTNNEGGTDDEEFRNVAVVDRVNTTMAVWMGTTMACAQCHNHKYDPLSQEEYFRLFAILNNTEDADKTDEAPLLSIYRPAQVRQRAEIQAEVDNLDRVLHTPTAEIRAGQARWEKSALGDSSPEKSKPDPAKQGASKGAPAVRRASPPGPVLEALKIAPAQRTHLQQAALERYYLTVAPELEATRHKFAALSLRLATVKPDTVPVMRELRAGKQRKTRIQHRGNFLDLGKEVAAGTPAAFPALPRGTQPDRLALARWLVDPKNPLTARVLANRYWEQIFGIGIVASSEEFGAQGDLPYHPELLDWIATELIRLKWDMKAFVKLLVMSAAYRQSSRVSPELQLRDPDNRLLARGPRFRLPAETVRDQALFVSGLLNVKMYGPPVKPPQPSQGLKAAFGSEIDWQTSKGADRYRRGLYTMWRRSNPYPSMAAFDAPNREVCTVRRVRTNTPLQALVTLNDPVYMEASQALARRTVLEGGSTTQSRARYAFRLCLGRPPSDGELTRLVELHQQASTYLKARPEQAGKLATDPLGPLPPGQPAHELAGWTLVSNVLLNLDEMLMKR
jgi:hypothetical protein